MALCHKCTCKQQYNVTMLMWHEWVSWWDINGNHKMTLLKDIRKSFSAHEFMAKWLKMMLLNFKYHCMEYHVFKKSRKGLLSLSNEIFHSVSQFVYINCDTVKQLNGLSNGLVREYDLSVSITPEQRKHWIKKVCRS